MSIAKPAAVYIMTNRMNGTLYIGATVDLARRAWEHREGVVPGFTKQYGCRRLVWYEAHDSLESALSREKQMKEWQRGWKIELIEATNPGWNDLFETLI